ncbi:NADP-dependent isocitrate dehydrogenase [Streptomyces fradiae]
MPQLKAAVAELQEQGYALPDYPDDPKTDEERPPVPPRTGCPAPGGRRP